MSNKAVEESIGEDLKDVISHYEGEMEKLQEKLSNAKEKLKDLKENGLG